MNTNKFAETQNQNIFDNGISNAQLVQESDQQAATAGYRQNVLKGQQQQRTEVSRHNKVIESPVDIREAYSANYATGEKTTAGPDGVMGTDDDLVKKYLTKEDFAKYQDDKKRAQGQTEATENQIRSQIANRFYTQLGYDDKMLEAFNKLPTDEKENVLDRFASTGVIPWNADSAGFWKTSNAV